MNYKLLFCTLKQFQYLFVRSFYFSGMAYLLLPLVAILYLKCPANRRIECLLVCSMLFLLSFNIFSLCVALLMSIINYLSLKNILNAENSRKKKLVYYATLILFIGFFIINRIVVVPQNIVLVGFSFYLLQLIGLLTDAYRGVLVSKPSLKEALLYQTFFPKLLQGPIEQYNHFSEQLKCLSKPSLQQYKKALLYLLLGIVLKLCVADRLHIAAHAAFDDNDIHGLKIWISICFYSIVLYADFSAYTYMAQAVGLLFAYELPDNFNKPFSARSITELWRRWHMSLMQWLQHYVFMPMGYELRRNKLLFPLTPIVTTFVLSALWHGFGLHFMLWGLFHASIILIELRTRKITWISKLPTLLLMPIVFVTFSIGNVFFNSKSFGQVCEIFSGMFNAEHFIPKKFYWGTLTTFIGNGDQESIMNLCSYAVLAFIILVCEYNFKKAHQQKDLKYCFVIFFLSMCILVFGNMHVSQPFIYRQF